LVARDSLNWPIRTYEPGALVHGPQDVLDMFMGHRENLLSAMPGMIQMITDKKGNMNIISKHIF
jgi:hypothetical protein